ncbi:MAG: hypothetical protein IKO78_06280 [Bacilli bacterium]|nr:hypothetical protein [Clostridia bacterium]MBR4672782.1 hypothetical protein [Bacilli bacterium]
MKKVYLFIIVFLLFVMFVPTANAARKACTKTYYSQLKSKAYKVTFNYDLHKEEGSDYYFTVTMANLQPGIVVEYGNIHMMYVEGKDIYEFASIFDGGSTYEFKIYAANGYACAGELLYTKSLKIPKYNIYSERDECIEYEEFPLCNKWYQKEIRNLDDFLQALELYKKSLEKEEPKDLEPEEETFFEKLINFYKDNIAITGTLTVLVIGGAGYYGFKKYQKKKKRAKIDIK